MNNRYSHLAIFSILAVLTYSNAHAAAPTPKAGVGDTNSPAIVTVAKEVSKKDVTASSVLERFSTYAGPRTPAAMSALFSQPFSSTVHQVPEVVLSNGASIVAIEAVLGTPDGTAPNFAFNGARLISNDRGTKGEWQVKALPDTGILKAEMIVLFDSSSLEIPLVVAPPLPAETDLSEKGFIAFLGGKNPNKQPMLDLNDDGLRDYIDDYIFTANYLVRLNTAASSPVHKSPPDQGESQAVLEPESPQPGAISPSESQTRMGEQGTAQTPETGASFSSNSGSGSNQFGQTSSPAANTGGLGVSPISTGSAESTGTTSGTSDPTGAGTGTTTGTGTSGILDHTVVKQRTYAEQQKIRNDQAKKNNQLIKVPNPVEVIY